MRRKLAMLGFAGAVAAAALSLTIVPSEQTLAASEPTFLVSSNDGYGIGECVSSGSSCAKVVADQWCMAQGYAHSATVGMADPTDMTGSISGAGSDRPISITCAK